MIHISRANAEWFIFKWGGHYVAELLVERHEYCGKFDTLAETKQYAVETAPEYPIRLSPACVAEMQGKVKP